MRIILVGSAMCLLMTWGTGKANTSKTAADSAIISVGLLVSQYASANGGRLPISWKEFIGSGFLTGEALSETRKFNNVEARYFFPQNVEISDGKGGKIKVVIMAKSPGGEGNSKTGEDGEIPGRYLIGRYQDGRIRAGRYTESNLEKLFSAKALRLADYTFASADQPKVEPPRNTRLFPFDPAVNRRVAEDNRGQKRNEQEGSDLQKNLTDGGNGNGRGEFFIIILTVFLGFVIMSSIEIVRRRRKR